MDEKETAQRLDALRERIRAQLEASPPPRLAADLVDSPRLVELLAAEMEAAEQDAAAKAATEGDDAGTQRPAEDAEGADVAATADAADTEAEEAPRPAWALPAVDTTPHLLQVDRLASITAPVQLETRASAVGPILTFLRRLARPFVQPWLDPYLARQEQFNLEVLAHLYMQGAQTEQRLVAMYEDLRGRIHEPRALEIRLDATLAEYDEALRQRHVVLFDALEEELWAVRARLTDAASRIQATQHEFDVRFVERAQAVDARFDAKDEALAALAARAAELDEIRMQSRVQTHALTEMLEIRNLLAETLTKAQAATAGATAADTPAGAAADGVDANATRTPFDAPLWSRLREWMLDQDYRAHQDRFRGAEDEIGARLAAHVRAFEGAPGPVADLGCGRGEFLALLSAGGIEAVGVEINEADVDACRAAGFEATHADLFDWLEARPAESLGGIFLAQVIEHLSPGQWQDLVRLAVSRLAPGGRLLIETINPESLFAMSRAYIIDPTHVRPVHPSLLSFLARRAGFDTVDVHYQAEVPADVRPHLLDEALAADAPELLPVVAQINKSLHRLDAFCYGPQEYALIATRRTS
jgi:SAM-dependent methyltransferase